MPLIEHLEWDSDFFGYKIGRLIPERLSLDDAAELRREMSARGFRCVYAFLDNGGIDSVRAAAEGRMILSDIRIVYELDAERFFSARSSDPKIKLLDEPNAADLDILRKIAREISGVSRFSFDPLFAPKAPAMYELWVENIVRDPQGAIIAARSGDVVSGFIGCVSRGDEAELVLVGVDDAMRGAGLGGQLVFATTLYLLRRGAKKIRVKTQLRNLPANRLYQRNGFVVSDVKLIYHIWNDL